MSNTRSDENTSDISYQSLPANDADLARPPVYGNRNEQQVQIITKYDALLTEKNKLRAKVEESQACCASPPQDPFNNPTAIVCMGSTFGMFMGLMPVGTVALIASSLSAQVATCTNTGLIATGIGSGVGCIAGFAGSLWKIPKILKKRQENEDALDAVEARLDNMRKGFSSP